MRRDSRAYLFDIVEAGTAILSFLKDSDFEAFAADDLLRSATERKFEVIGEALNQLSRLDLSLVERIARWRDIVAFRNILAHGYATVDHRLVWRAYEESLPALLAEAQALLRGEAGHEAPPSGA